MDHPAEDRVGGTKRTLTVRIVRLPAAGAEPNSNDQSVMFRRDQLLIGRRSRDYFPAAGICPNYFVTDQQPYNVSRLHCSIERTGNRLEVIDLSSRLGTEVNGRRIGTAAGEMRAPLRMGDNEVVLGTSINGTRFLVTVCRAPE